MVKQYRGWVKTEGILEELTDVIEEAKHLLYETAEEKLQSEGIDIKEYDVQWSVKQMYCDPSGQLNEEPTENSIPYVIIEWKATVKKRWMKL